MAATPLVAEDIRDGESLIRQLDRDGFPVSAAFWYFQPDVEKWQLIVASPIVSNHGPLEAYRRLGDSARRVRSPRNRQFQLDTTRVKLVKEQDELPSLLRRAITTGHGISGIRFTSNTIDGSYVEDAYIYRLEQPAAA